MGMILAIVGGLVLVIGGAAAAYFLWLRSTGPELAKYAPKDTTMYFEVPSLTKALVSFAGIDFVNVEELDAEGKKDEYADAFASSFDVDKEDASDLMKSISSIGVAFREESKHDKKGAVMIAFSSAGPMEKLLESTRFKEKDELAGGKSYKITKKEVDDDKKEKLSSAEKLFNDMGASKDADKDEEKKTACVWFSSKKLFVCGDTDFVEDTGKVISGDKEGLAATSDTFKKAKWPSGSTMLFWADPDAIDKDAKKDFFDGTGPITVSSRFTDAGMMITAQAELKGKKLPSENLFDAPGKLELNQKLPATTFAYFELSTKTSLEGKELHKKLVKAFNSADENSGDDADKQLEKMKDEIGFDLDTVLDAVGDEMIIGVTATDKIKFDAIKTKDKDALKELGLVFIAHLRDKEKAEKILKSLKDVAEDKGKDAIEVTKEDDSYTFEPKEALKAMGIPTVKASIMDDKYLLVAVGSKSRIEEIETAFGGENTLKDDKAHTKALKSFDQKPQAILWVDAGRIAAVALDDDDLKKMVEKGLKESGFKIDTFNFEGDDRMTAAMSFAYSVDKDGMWSVESEALNAFAFSAAGLASFAARATPPEEAHTDDSDGGSGGGDTPVIGIANCDSYFKKMNQCANKMGGAGGDAMRNAMKQAADSMKQAAANAAARSALDSSCQQMLDALAKNPACN